MKVSVILMAFLIAVSINAHGFAPDSCQKPGAFLLIDVFVQERVDDGYQSVTDSVGMIDVDGDGVKDMSHGDFVARIFRLSGKPLKTLGLRTYGGHEIETALGNLRYALRTQAMEKPAGIIMPISFSMARTKFEKRYISFQGDVTNFKERFIKRVIAVDGRDSNFMKMKSFFDFFSEQGIPFYVPAGNNYGTHVNIAALLGAQSVGALSLKNNPAVYSDHDAFTSVMTVGDILSRKVPGGIDLNNDGVADIYEHELSGQKLSRSDLPVLEEYDPNVPEFFISSRTFNHLSGIHSQEKLDLIAQELGDYIHFPSGDYYRQINGQMVYQPLQGVGDYAYYSYGTSFAVANLCY